MPFGLDKPFALRSREEEEAERISVEYQNFVFIRHERIKTLGVGTIKRYGAITRWAHQVRAQKTENADETRFADNQICCSETQWKLVSMKPKRTANVLPVWLDKKYLAAKTAAEIKRYGITSIRKDATFLEELFLEASPDWLRDNKPGGDWNPQKTRDWVRITIEYLKYTYGEKLLAIVVHLDEMTPHVAAFVLPVVYREEIIAPGPVGKKGKREPRKGYRLAASELFSGGFKVKARERRNEPQVNMCSRNQTDYALFCQNHGLDVRRGIKNSRTKHRRMRAHYHLIHQPAPELQKLRIPTSKEARYLGKKSGESYPEFLDRYLTRLIEKEQKARDSAHAKALEYDNESSLRRHYEKLAADKSDLVDAVTAELNEIKLGAFKRGEKIEELQAELAKVKEAVPPITVLEALSDLLGHNGTRKGAEVHFDCPSGETICVHPESNTFSAGAKDASSTGTRRALEIALGLGRDKTLEWMLSRYPSAEVGATLAAETNQNRQAKKKARGILGEAFANALTPNALGWSTLKKALKSRFGLSEEYLERLHKDGLISANEKGLPLFTKFEDHTGRKRGTAFYLGSNTPGYIGGLDSEMNKPGLFVLNQNNQAKRLIVTDCAIIAVMVNAALAEMKGMHKCRCIAIPIQGVNNLRFGTYLADDIGSVAAVITLQTVWGKEIRAKIEREYPSAVSEVLKSSSKANVFEEAMETYGNCRDVFDRIKFIVKTVLEPKEGKDQKPSRRKDDPEMNR